MFKKILLSVVASTALFSAGLSHASELTIGSKAYAEQLLLAEMTSQLLNENGFKAKKMTGMGGSLLRQAMENAQIDMCWEYTGTSLVTYNKITDRLGPEETYERVKELDAKKNIIWLNPSEANNTYAVAVRRDEKNTSSLNTLSDLAQAYNDGSKLKMATSAEFPKREDGLLGLQKTYDFKVGRRNLSPMHAGLVYQALRDGDVDVAMVFSTDGRIAAFDFKVLEDDRDFFPSYAMTPTVRKEILEANPGLEPLLNKLSAVLDDETMQDLNAKVAVEEISVEKVAKEFLTQHNLI